MNTFYRRSRQAGFTMIELVTVIILLGILAATALPRFINISEEAEASVVDQLVGSLITARTLAFSKMLLANVGYDRPEDLTFDSFVQCDRSQDLAQGDPLLGWDGNWFGMAGVRSSVFADPDEEDVCVTNQIQFAAKSGRTITISIGAGGGISYTASPAY